MSYELFVEVLRGDVVESQHFGAAVVCDYRGRVLHRWGDIDQLVYPRSAIKPIQCLGLIESGASEHYNLSDAELALSCASHRGEQMHTRQVTEWLERLGFNQSCLACGLGLPLDIVTSHQLLADGESGCRVHHNCSGKHAGFLTTARFLRHPVDNYHELDHPVQQQSLNIIADLAQVDIEQYPVGIDGCGFPALSLPLKNLGIAMARFANPEGLSEPRANAIKRLQAAITHEPYFLSGHGCSASELIAETQGEVLAKTGAEGMFVAALPKRGLGIALKIADGSSRANSVALLAILDHIDALTEDQKQSLKQHISPLIINSRDETVGLIRPALSTFKSEVTKPC